MGRNESLWDRPKRLRLGALLAACDDAPLPALADGLSRYRKQIAGHGVDVLIGVRKETTQAIDESNATAQGGRLFEPADAVLELTLNGPGQAQTLVERIGGAAEALCDVVDAQRSGCVVGTAYLINQFPGATLMGMLGRREASITAERFSRWWLEQHGPMALELLGARHWSYEQLHGDDGATAIANSAAGFGDRRFNVFESIRVDSLEDFLTAFTPDAAQRVQQDEVGFLDHGQLRITWTDLVP